MYAKQIRYVYEMLLCLNSSSMLFIVDKYLSSDFNTEKHIH